MEFVERKLIEKGFAEVFASEIEPKLARLEQGRKAELNQGYIYAALIVLLGFVIVGGVYLIWGETYALRLSPVVVIIFGITAWSFATSGSGKWAKSVNATLMPIICDHVGDLSYEPQGNFYLGPLIDMRLLPKHDKASQSHHMVGTYDGTPYEMAYVQLTSQVATNNDTTRTVIDFEGLVFQITVPNPAPGRIVMMRERGGLGNKVAETFAFGSTRSLPKVTFDHSAFEAAFEVYADKPDEAKDYMNTDLLQAMLRIGKEHGRGLDARAFVAGFRDQNLYVALNRSGPFIELGKINEPVDQIEGRIHSVFDGILIPHQIIDRLKTA